MFIIAVVRLDTYTKGLKMSNYTVKDNSKEVLSALENAIFNSLDAIGKTAETNAKKLTPVDTGRLRNSITNAVATDEKAVYIGTNVEYAPYVELGARGRAGVHMLQRAATEHKDEYQKKFNNEMKNAK